MSGIEKNQIIFHLTDGTHICRELTASKQEIQEVNPLIESFEIVVNTTDRIGLERLIIHGTQIKRIPPSIGKLTHLKSLWFFNNQLEEIPKELCHLTQLTKLSLADNKISRLPKEFGNLKSLDDLCIKGNLLNSLPQEIVDVPCKKFFSCENNPLISLPSSMQEKMGCNQLVWPDQRAINIFQYSTPKIELIRLPSSLIERTQPRLDEINNDINTLGIPSLRAIAGNVVVQNDLEKSQLPTELQDYLPSAQICHSCGKKTLTGISYSKIEKIGKGGFLYTLPFEYHMCQITCLHRDENWVIVPKKQA
jgi:hypothetical protein